MEGQDDHEEDEDPWTRAAKAVVRPAADALAAAAPVSAAEGEAVADSKAPAEAETVATVAATMT